MELSQQKIDQLNMVASTQGIPVEELIKYYTKQINDQTCIAAFPKEEDLFDYVDNLLSTHIQEFHSAVMTEYEVVVMVSSAPKTSKAGNLYNNHVMMAKIPGNDQKAPRWMNVVNNEDTGNVVRLEPLSTGTIKVNVKDENEVQINAFSRSNTEFVPKVLSWVANGSQSRDEKKEWAKKAIRQFTVATAGQNLSAKTADGKGINPCSLRWIQGNIATHRIIKKTDDKTGLERVTGIITITDKTVMMIPDFGKSKQVADPKNPGKTMTEYGGFSAFADPEDIKLIGKGSECIFIGTLTNARQMNVGTVLPILAIAPKKPTDKLQKPNTNPSSPSAPAAPSNVIDASAVSPAGL